MRGRKSNSICVYTVDFIDHLCVCVCVCVRVCVRACVCVHCVGLCTVYVHFMVQRTLAVSALSGHNQSWASTLY